MSHLILETGPITTLTLNRAEMHNAFDEVLIEELIQALENVASDDTCRLLVLKAKGKSFSAGADLNWMKKMATFSEEENKQDALKLGRLMHLLYTFPKPTLGLVQGAAFGGGVGLVACLDIVGAVKEASFCFSEVLLGLIPAVISPYVVRAIGARQAGRYFLSAEKFSAARALEIGLVHEVLEDGSALEAWAEKLTHKILKGGPKSQTLAKELVQDVADQNITQSLQEEVASRIAKCRASEEGKDGISAFLNKSKPTWTKDD